MSRGDSRGQGNRAELLSADRLQQRLSSRDGESGKQEQIIRVPSFQALYGPDDCGSVTVWQCDSLKVRRTSGGAENTAGDPLQDSPQARGWGVDEGDPVRKKVPLEVMSENSLRDSGWPSNQRVIRLIPVPKLTLTAGPFSYKERCP
ncbi:unnamed protein product [Pleuronectes platessa]|uniref:Uncharacterized protein n=1 Tax=Pleuronectes platessa TaxID=8262 RepID=A0A9N7U132_PLEPL|nr:unnamed protein product [Pleuronectes platessa]